MNDSAVLFHGSILETVKFLGALPFWEMLFLLLVVICTMLFTLIFITHHARKPLTERTIAAGASMGSNINTGIYGLILGFLVISMYDTNRKVKQSTFEEANTLVSILETAKPLNNAPQIRGAVKNYTHHLLEKEWPLICEDHLEEAWKQAPAMIDSLYQAVEASQPVGVMQEQSCSALFGLLKDLTNDHRSRLMQADTCLPIQFWRIIVLMSILSLWFLVYMNPWTGSINSLIPIVIPGLIIALSLALLISLQYPYQGPFAISNKVYSLGALDFSHDQ
ncbi:MAG: DUF4239 domain-containing protein [Chthoniobacterales bacterium]|nr:DUF4239 domain-containing protein [Chthoniobacterales bacterium]